MRRVSLTEFDPIPVGTAQYPIPYIEEHGVIVLNESETTVEIGICDAGDEGMLAQLEVHHQKEVLPYEVDRIELSAYVGKASAESSFADGYLTSGTDEKLLLDKLANDAPVVNLVNSTLIEAVRLGASDIHIESFEQDALVRYRIDGELQTVNRVSISVFPAVASRLKVMANLNIMEKRLPQDGRVSVRLAGEAIDIRMSAVPTVGGESIVLRLLYKRGAPESLDDIGMDAEQLAAFRAVSHSPHGLILVTGPTGSGKTTTLNACLRELNRDTQKIITIEDPVEYSIPGIDQIQTNEAIGLTFDSLLRRVLRQDPNIIMVGEIRDEPTAALAVRAALTGHLVLATLHTNDSVSSVGRMLDMGVKPYLLAAVIRGVLAQRLVRRVGGGRLGVFELFVPTEKTTEMIGESASTGALWEEARRTGMRTLSEDARKKAAAGLTTEQEMAAVVDT